MHQPMFYDRSFLKSCKDASDMLPLQLGWLNCCSSTSFMLAFTECLKSGLLSSTTFRREYAVAALRWYVSI